MLVYQRVIGFLVVIFFTTATLKQRNSAICKEFGQPISLVKNGIGHIYHLLAPTYLINPSRKKVHVNKPLLIDQGSTSTVFGTLPQ